MKYIVRGFNSLILVNLCFMAQEMVTSDECPQILEIKMQLELTVDADILNQAFMVKL